jgi:hypothetical protein
MPNGSLRVPLAIAVDLDVPPAALLGLPLAGRIPTLVDCKSTNS